LKAWGKRVPEYIEQLIPFELRVHHNIPFDQKTPISNVNTKPLLCNHKLAEVASDRMDGARSLMKGESVQASKDIGVCNICRPVLEIPEDKDGGSHTANIRATLSSHNLPSSSGKENKKLLETFAGINGTKLILMSRTKVTPNKIIEPVQKDDTATVSAQDKGSPSVQKKEIKIKKKPGNSS